MEQLTAFLDYLKDPDTAYGVFDLVYGLILFYGLIRGIFRGLPEELSQLLGTVAVFFGATRFYTPVSEVLLEHTRLEDPTASMALAYALLFLLILIVWKLITFLIKKTLDWSCPKQIKHLGGGIVGVAKNAILIAVLLAAVLITEHEKLGEAMIEKSWFGRQAVRLLPASITQEAGDAGEEGEADGSGDA